jgi:hypothetical protein
LDFPVAKLLDLKWEDLSASRNPFAVLVQAHLKTQATLGDDPGRLSWKLALVRGLYERGLGREAIVRLFGFVDHLMALPQGLDEQFRNELAMFESESKMPYVTSIERLGIRKGLEQGLEQGRLANARESVLDALEVRFGQVPDAMKKRILSVSDPADCRLLLQAAIKAASVEAFEQRLGEVAAGDRDAAERCRMKKPRPPSGSRGFPADLRPAISGRALRRPAIYVHPIPELRRFIVGRLTGPRTYRRRQE